jgi:lantibiotic modifying enzyme
MYSGVVGICYFLKQLAISSGLLRFNDAVDRAFESMPNDSGNDGTGKASFLTGSYSVPYEMKNSQTISNNESLQANLPCEFLNGYSGTLVALLHMSTYKNLSKPIADIDTLTGHLIDNCHLSRRGPIWDRSATNIFGLCGFSHGASGIAFAFLELARLSSNMSFSWVGTRNNGL